jgi:hypothetical protein
VVYGSHNKTSPHLEIKTRRKPASLLGPVRSSAFPYSLAGSQRVVLAIATTITIETRRAYIWRTKRTFLPQI